MIRSKENHGISSPLLGLDLGLKRTGVALSESGLLAQPIGVIEAKPPHMTGVVQEILGYIKKYEIATLVIGVPYTEDEATTSQALKVEQIITQIDDALHQENLLVTIERINEFHSTRDATALYPTTDADSAAAALILQDFLDQHA